MPVSVFNAVTAAPAIVAPLGSRTVPEILALTPAKQTAPRTRSVTPRYQIVAIRPNQRADRVSGCGRLPEKLLRLLTPFGMKLASCIYTLLITGARPRAPLPASPRKLRTPLKSKRLYTLRL